MSIYSFFKQQYINFRYLSKTDRKKLYRVLAFLLFPCRYLSGLTSFRTIGKGVLYYFIYSVTTTAGIVKLILFYLFIILFSLVRIHRKNPVNTVESTDERGVSYLKDGTLGTGNFMDREELRTVFTVCDISQTTEQVFGQLSESGREVVAFRENKTGGNRNTFILGSPGTGKSYGFVRTRAIQSVLRGESVVLTDPSSELYTSLSKFFTDSGCAVKVFNLTSPVFSDAWNCLSECISPQTGRLNALRLQEFCDIFMKNSAPKGSVSDFWSDSATNLLRAVIGMCRWKHETDMYMGYRLLMETISKGTKYAEHTEEYFEKHPFDESNLYEIKKEFLSLCRKVRISKKNISLYLNETEKLARPFSIRTVYSYILNIQDFEAEAEKFAALPFDHPGRIAFTTFNRSGVRESVKRSALQGLLLRLKLFMDNDIRRITSCDDIVLAELGIKQTAVFLITPDNSDAMKPIQALFFSFLFRDLSESYDRYQSECETTGKTNDRLPVNILMDEAYSNGMIANFATAMATTRKRKLYVTMIWQTIGQVLDMYGQNIRDTLKSCCDTMIFLGTRDLSTAKYVSEFSGTRTVRSQSHRESTVSIFRQDTAREVSYSEAHRPVLTTDEILGINEEVLVIRRGYRHVAKLKRFGYTEHPVFIQGKLTAQSIFDYPRADTRYMSGGDVSEGSESINRMAKLIKLFSKEQKKVYDSVFSEENTEEITNEKINFAIPQNKKEKKDGTNKAR